MRISKKKPYETSHSGMSLKIWDCSMFGKIKKIPAKNLLILTFCKITVLHLWYFGKH